MPEQKQFFDLAAAWLADLEERTSSMLADMGRVDPEGSRIIESKARSLQGFLKETRQRLEGPRKPSQKELEEARARAHSAWVSLEEEARSRLAGARRRQNQDREASG